MVNDTQLEPTLEDLAIEAAMFLETLPTYVSDNTLCRAGQMAFALRTCVENHRATAATPSPETAVGGEAHGHVDFVFRDMQCCKVCGLVRPAEGWTRKCKGPVELSLRSGDKS